MRGSNGVGTYGIRNVHQLMRGTHSPTCFAMYIIGAMLPLHNPSNTGGRRSNAAKQNAFDTLPHHVPIMCIFSIEFPKTLFGGFALESLCTLHWFPHVWVVEWKVEWKIEWNIAYNHGVKNWAKMGMTNWVNNGMKSGMKKCMNNEVKFLSNRFAP